MIEPIERAAATPKRRRTIASPLRLTRDAPAPNRLITGDCLEVMRGWPDGCIDHCVVDPPFNIGSGSGRKGKAEQGEMRTDHQFPGATLLWLTRSERQAALAKPALAPHVTGLAP